MSRLLYFYVSDGCRAENQKVGWDINNKSTNRFALNVAQEGVFQLWNRLVEDGVFSEAITFVDSMRGRHGTLQITKHSKAISIPHLSDVLPLLKEDDVVIVRGAWKSWFPVLQEIQKRGHWILFYRANTNRGPWPFWDVTLNDLIDSPRRAANRLHFNFFKPVNEKLFYPIPDSEKIFDVILNASHIHVKKGQHRFIQAAAEYKKIYGKDLEICLPGGFIRSWAHKVIHDTIRENKLKVYLPGAVQRKELNILMNKSRFYAHIGTGGQNDRGTLEAMRCGLPVMISNTKAFAPFVYKNPAACFKISTDSSIEGVARMFHEMRSHHGNAYYCNVADYYLKKNGMNVAVAKMTDLFNKMRDIGKPDRKAILERFFV